MARSRTPQTRSFDRALYAGVGIWVLAFLVFFLGGGQPAARLFANVLNLAGLAVMATAVYLRTRGRWREPPEQTG